jgi:hypothetical protein
MASLFNYDKTIILLYEYSGVFTRLYREAGYNVIQVDYQIDKTDVRLMKKIKGNVYGILAFPPCTHLASSGARWWNDKGEPALLEALSTVDAVYRMVGIYQPSGFWGLENPIGRLVHYIGKPDFTFDPCDYAGYADNPDEEAYTKKTYLWGVFNNPVRKAVPPVLGSKMHTMSKVPDRQNIRSKTPEGFARAFFNANK